MNEHPCVNDDNPNIEHWRIFAAVPVNAGIRAVMQSTQHRLANLKLPVRWVDPRLAHITLRFYGDSSPEAVAVVRSALGEIAAQHASMQLTTAGIGAFPSAARPRVLWLGLAGDTRRLRALAMAIDPHDVKVSSRARAFKPHVTLARVRDGASPITDFAGIAARFDVPSVELTVDCLQLVRSILGPKGPTYSVIDEWRLGEPRSVPAIATTPGLHEHT